MSELPTNRDGGDGLLSGRYIYFKKYSLDIVPRTDARSATACRRASLPPSPARTPYRTGGCGAGAGGGQGAARRGPGQQGAGPPPPTGARWALIGPRIVNTAL